MEMVVACKSIDAVTKAADATPGVIRVCTLTTPCRFVERCTHDSLCKTFCMSMELSRRDCDVLQCFSDFCATGLQSALLLNLAVEIFALKFLGLIRSIAQPYSARKSSN